MRWENNKHEKAGAGRQMERCTKTQKKGFKNKELKTAGEKKEDLKNDGKTKHQGSKKKQEYNSELQVDSWESYRLVHGVIRV